MMSKTAVVYVTYDGAVNAASGVGVLSQYFIESVSEIIRGGTEDMNSELELHVVAIDLSAGADGYSDAIKDRTRSICHETGGELRLIDNGMCKGKGYGGPENWRIASRHAAEVIDEISSHYDHTLVYLVDTPFLGVPYYSKQRSALQGITFILVPHSDTFSHFPDNIDIERLAWEAAGFEAPAIFDSVFLARTSRFLLRALYAHHKFPNDKVVDLQTGLFLPSARFSYASDEEIKKELKTYNIPVDKDLIFSVGRGVPYKGFEDLIESFALVADQNPKAHLVFIAPPHKNEEGITGILLDHISRLGIVEKCTPLFELNMSLPRLICQWGGTKIVAQLSHREPFGMVPEEVRIWAKNKGPINVVSQLDGFLEQIEHGTDGFFVKPSHHREVAEIFSKILHMTDEEYDNIRNNGYKRAVTDYNYQKSIELSIKDLIGRRL